MQPNNRMTARLTRSAATSAVISSFPPVYDPTEGYEAFTARQKRAYDAGREAVREQRIKPALRVFYEILVGYVSSNAFCFVGEERLAEECNVDVATIKRWMAKLVQAGLIRRQRRYGTSSLTFITAYDPPGEDRTDNLNNSDYRQPDPAPDTPDVRRKNAPTFGAKMRRESFKTTQLNQGGGGIPPSAQKSEVIEPEKRALLEREGVAEYVIAPQLAQKPLAELQAVSRYVKTQRHVRDRSRLFAWLAGRDFGAQLTTQQERPRPRPKRQEKPSKYLSGELAYLIQGATEAQPEASRPATEEPEQPRQADQGATWQQALDLLREQVTASEYAAWFSDTMLLELDSERAIVGVANVFARDTLRSCYQEPIAQAMQAVIGRELVIQIEIRCEGSARSV